MTKYYNLIREDCLDDTSTLFNDYDVITVFPRSDDCARWDQLAVFIGLFPSLKQARHNGWSGDLPKGWVERLTTKHKLYMWNPTHNTEEWAVVYPELFPDDNEEIQ